MTNFNYEISEQIVDFNGQNLKVISVKIILDSSRFLNRAVPLSVYVQKGVITIESWKKQYSGNLKEVEAWFTTDAFENLTSPVSIVLKYESEVFGEISPVFIEDIIPLNSPTTNFIDADNAWLQNELDSQDE